MKELKPIQKISLVIARLFRIISPTMEYIKIGLPPVIIVGGQAIIGFFLESSDGKS